MTQVCRYNMAQCRLHGLAIFNIKTMNIFSDKIYGSNFIKQHSETVMIWNYQNADCTFAKNFFCVMNCSGHRHDIAPNIFGDIKLTH